jgi:hypothetical protein
MSETSSGDRHHDEHEIHQDRQEHASKDQDDERHTTIEGGDNEGGDNEGGDNEGGDNEGA